MCGYMRCCLFDTAGTLLPSLAKKRRIRETLAALTALGDHLSANQWIEAAHAWYGFISCIIRIFDPHIYVFSYLLSPQTSQLGGLGAPTIRLVLVGSASPAVTPTFSRDTDSLILSEIVEFSYSLSPPQKGQEPFPGLSHLQPYSCVPSSAAFSSRNS